MKNENENANENARWLVLALMLGLLMPLLGTPAGGMAQRADPRTRPAAVQSPILGPIRDIWVDGLQNATPAVAYNSRRDEYLVVWKTVQDAYTENIWARRVGGDGSLRSSFNVATGEAEKRWQPVVAYSPAQDEYLIVYTYMVSVNDYDLYAKLVSSNGGLISSEFTINYDPSGRWPRASPTTACTMSTWWSTRMRGRMAGRTSPPSG